MEKEEIMRRVEEAKPWFHRIDLGQGIITPGNQGEDTQNSLLRMHIPPVLAGKKVLDIGAFDGFYSLECEKRGAQVVALDKYTNKQGNELGGNGGGSIRGIRLVKEAMGAKFDIVDCDLFDIPPHKFGTYDLVLMLGVIYHLKNPLAAIELACSLSKDMIIIESETSKIKSEDTIMQYLPSGYRQDKTCYWFPNALSIQKMVESCGFRAIIRDDNGNRAVIHGWRRK